MSHYKKFLSLTKSDWLVAAIILTLFLLTNGYIYGWDDQHLEIPLLKKLMDGSLYPGDYYVESLKKNFTSYFYPILARLITIDQIETAYLILYLLSRYFLFFWMFKLWNLLTKDRVSAFLCVLMFFLIGRTEEFLYRSFSHQELALSIIFAGIYFFYRERFYLASALLGLSANIHSLYSLFPMIYLGVYLLFHIKKHGIKTLLISGLIFLISITPLLAWIMNRLIENYGSTDPGLYKNWYSLFLIACPQNFLFDYPPEFLLKDISLFFLASKNYLLLIFLFLLNFFNNDSFRKDRKTLCMCGTVLFLLCVSYVFTYVYPSRFVLDLNLIRNVQYLKVFLMGYTAHLLFQTVQKEKVFYGLLLGLLFSSLKYVQQYTFLIGAYTLVILFSYLKWNHKPKGERLNWKGIFWPFMLGFCLLGIVVTFPYPIYKALAVFIIYVNFGLLFLNYLLCHSSWGKSNLLVLKKLFLIIPLSAILLHYALFQIPDFFYYRKGEGTWQLQKYWIDIQKYVHANTPKDALILVPHNLDMAGFRIFSERKILASFRDCGLIGFDYKTALEWHKRIQDIEEFKLWIEKPFERTVIKAIFDYNVNYIVFLRYYEPGKNSTTLKKIYANKIFSLYQVLRNPI